MTNVWHNASQWILSPAAGAGTGLVDDGYENIVAIIGIICFPPEKCKQKHHSKFIVAVKMNFEKCVKHECSTTTISRFHCYNRPDTSTSVNHFAISCGRCRAKHTHSTCNILCSAEHWRTTNSDGIVGRSVWEKIRGRLSSVAKYVESYCEQCSAIWHGMPSLDRTNDYSSARVRLATQPFSSG